jgi:hypothetical protein
MSPNPRSQTKRSGSSRSPELSHHAHPYGFLGLDELTVEQLDQHVALVRMQRVLPQFHHVASVQVRHRENGRVVVAVQSQAPDWSGRRSHYAG